MQKNKAEKPTIDEQIQMKKILKNVDSDKQQQHSKLMDEFRIAHRKMFKTNNEEVSSKESSDCSETMASIFFFNN